MASTAVCSDILTYLRGAAAPATAAEIATATGRGRSTVTAALRGLEADGHTCRIQGEREAGKRLPDLWSLPRDTEPSDAPAPDAAQAAEATAPASPEHPAPASAAAFSDPAKESMPASPADDGAGEDPDADPAADAAAHEVPTDASAGDAAAAPRPAANAAAPATSNAPAAAAPAGTAIGAEGAHTQTNKISGSPRLAPGELRLMVKAILEADPDEEFSATEISHTLRGRSVGAIQNVLARLVKDDEAELTCAAPRRYSAA